MTAVKPLVCNSRTKEAKTITLTTEQKNKILESDDILACAILKNTQTSHEWLVFTYVPKIKGDRVKNTIRQKISEQKIELFTDVETNEVYREYTNVYEVVEIIKGEKYIVSKSNKEKTIKERLIKSDNEKESTNEEQSNDNVEPKKKGFFNK